MNYETRQQRENNRLETSRASRGATTNLELEHGMALVGAPYCAKATKGKQERRSARGHLINRSSICENGVIRG